MPNNDEWKRRTDAWIRQQEEWNRIKKKSSWFVYIILTDQDSLYTGITTDLQRRFQEHLDTANGKPKARGAKFFRSTRPLQIVHSEVYRERSKASQREAQIKALNKAEKQKLLQNLHS